MWGILNIDEDRKEKFELLDQVLKSLHPWLSPELYARQKQKEELQAKVAENASSSYEDELRSRGFSKEEIEELVKFASKG